MTATGDRLENATWSRTPGRGGMDVSGTRSWGIETPDSASATVRAPPAPDEEIGGGAAATPGVGGGSGGGGEDRIGSRVSRPVVDGRKESDSIALLRCSRRY